MKVPTDETGEIVSGRTYWQQKVKEVAYAHLKISVRKFQLHTPKQWELIHAELAQLFYIDPPLKTNTVEKYIQEHLSQARQNWRRMWKVGGETTRADDCPADAWLKLI